MHNLPRPTSRLGKGIAGLVPQEINVQSGRALRGIAALFGAQLEFNDAGIDDSTVPAEADIDPQLSSHEVHTALQSNMAGVMLIALTAGNTRFGKIPTEGPQRESAAVTAVPLPARAHSTLIRS